jgi:putative nucleotidyltransferase with HDIG domain
MTPEQIAFAENFTPPLMVALTARDRDTAAHAVRVQNLAVIFGQALGLPTYDLQALKFGSLLHDLGKLRTPDQILHKPTQLTPSEMTTMRLHAWDGANILRSLSFPGPICRIVEQHHECWDGSGYPFGYSNTQIELGARILSVADAYDAITADRCYRRGAAPETAFQRLAESAGTQFDPNLVANFIHYYQSEPLDFTGARAA